jgi:hypothetical protein
MSQGIPLKKQKKSNFLSLFRVANLVETVSRTIAVKVELIIEMTDWMAGKFEQKGELGQPNDRYMHTDNRWAMWEEGSCIVHEEKRIFPLLIDRSEKV